MDDRLFVLLERLIDKLPAWISGPVVLSIAIGFAITFLRFVKEAEQGLVLRFGKVRRHYLGAKKGQPMIKLPGFIIVLPKIDQLVTRHTREQTLKLDPQEVILKDGSIFRVESVVFFRITNVYKALFEIADLDTGIKNLLGGELREVLQGLEGVEAIKDVEAVSRKVHDATKDIVAGWGTDLTRFKLTDCKPSQETSAAVTAPTVINARMDALRKAGLDKNPQLAAAVLGAQAVNAIQPS